VHLGSPEGWRIIWVIAAAFFIVAELLRRLRFFFLPFAAGAALAAASAFAGLLVAGEWALFVVVSAAGLAVLIPVGRRLAAEGPLAPVGSNRWVHQQGVVLEAVPGSAGSSGLVRIGRETWRAESGYGDDIPVGTEVFVTRVEGTRLIVLPVVFPASPTVPSIDEGK